MAINEIPTILSSDIEDINEKKINKEIEQKEDYHNMEINKRTKIEKEENENEVVNIKINKAEIENEVTNSTINNNNKTIMTQQDVNVSLDDSLNKVTVSTNEKESNMEINNNTDKDVKMKETEEGNALNNDTKTEIEKEKLEDEMDITVIHENSEKNENQLDPFSEAVDALLSMDESDKEEEKYNEVINNTKFRENHFNILDIKNQLQDNKLEDSINIYSSPLPTPPHTPKPKINDMAMDDDEIEVVKEVTSNDNKTQNTTTIDLYHANTHSYYQNLNSKPAFFYTGGDDEKNGDYSSSTDDENDLVDIDINDTPSYTSTLTTTTSIPTPTITTSITEKIIKNNNEDDLKIKENHGGEVSDSDIYENSGDSTLIPTTSFSSSSFLDKEDIMLDSSIYNPRYKIW